MFKVHQHFILNLTFLLLIIDRIFADVINANTFYVKFTSSPFTSSRDHIEAQHDNFHKELFKRGIHVKIKDVFKRYANGLSIEIDKRHVKRIAEIEHVESVEPVEIYRRINPINFDIKKRAESYNQTILIASNNDINSVHEVTGVKKVHEELKLTGKGVKVGFIDSGIDYTHPALGGCFGPGCRVAFGYNFVNNTDDPYDNCNGHGTHVAAIAGGMDPRDDGPGFVGVAPDVIFGAYRIYPCIACENNECANNAEEIIIMKAIIRAGIAGNNKNMLATLVNELTKYKGIIFIVALGNNGMSGLFTGGLPATAENTIGIGSFETNKVLNFNAFDPRNPEFVINYITNNVSAFPFKNAKVSLFPMDKCLNDYKEFDNTVIIVDLRTELKCPELTIRLAKIKPLAVLASLKFDGLQYFELPYLPAEYGAMISSKQADIIIKYLEEYPNLELDFSDKYGYMENHPFAATPSVFTSWGLSHELDIKPEVCAPGGLILSAFPVNLGPYVLKTGTSMAAPYITGVTALFYEVFGKRKSPELIKTALMNNAVPLKSRNKLLASVLHQGAGLVNAFNALIATSFVYPPKINLNDTVHFNGYHKLTVYNFGTSGMKYKLSHLPAPCVDGYNNTLISNFYELKFLTNQHADVRFDNDQITVPPGSSVGISITFTPPRELPKDGHWFYSGWVIITPLDERLTSMTVPYAGLADDAKSLPIFQTPIFPKLADLAENYITNNDSVKSFSFNMSIRLLIDKPTVFLNLATPTEMIFTEILDANQTFLGWVKDFTGIKVVKNPTEKSNNLVTWDGIIYNQNDTGTLAPNGEYFIRIKALKLFGDNKNEKDYEYWISPKFRVERPIFTNPLQ
ncbi:4133_t:CDS:2 [Funneliformis geosporum]|uniref:10461_t:CDS:1 n=1 Tax=Funneliformis geosporum TaxID=1117311 RepID=A0A9W4SNB0_9GLOM|nr:10461_t:CDS:2 [Funneliformis geosporum]CAI2183498.1 4133_t:CDS:2 [Funneliformis geosporum]